MDPLALFYLLFFRPREAFRYLATRRPLAGAALIFSLATFLFFLGGYFRLHSASPLFSSLAPFLFFLSFFSALFAWPLSAFLLDLFARFLGGVPARRELLTCLGFASFPLALGGIGELAASAFAFPALGGAARSLALLWAFFLAVLALKEVYSFSLCRAFFAFFLPGIVFFLLLLSFFFLFAAGVGGLG